MHPIPQFHAHQYNPSNQPNINGTTALVPQQVIGNQVYSGPNQMQIPPQFHMGLLNSPQFAMSPFANPNAYFAPTQFFPFLQGSLPTLNTNNFMHNAVNTSQFLPNGQLNLPNSVQNVNQLMQMQMASCGPQNLGHCSDARMGLGNGNGVVPQSGEGSQGKLGNARIVNVDNDRKNSWKKSHNKKFNGNHTHDASQRGFRQKQFHHRKNAQGDFKLNNENGENWKKNNGVQNVNLSSPGEQIQVGEKRALYTEQEIQQWCEARRKHYPSKVNMDKKLKGNMTQPEVMDPAALMRRQQLKEILAKQAELGCEVAEVPSYYLLGSDLQTDGRQQNRKGFGKNSRKRRRNNGCKQTHSEKIPSLLKKLLSSDIKRDKRHLLQVFRFMAMNSFFENFPEKPLKFPVVIVKESGDGSQQILEVKPQPSAPER